VARAIVGQAERPRRMVVVGAGGGLLTRLHTLAPSLAEWFTARMIELQHTRMVPVESTTGNLFAPMAEGTEPSGGWQLGQLPVARITPNEGATACHQ
jgi:hypothetical protein